MSVIPSGALCRINHRCTKYIVDTSDFNTMDMSAAFVICGAQAVTWERSRIGSLGDLRGFEAVVLASGAGIRSVDAMRHRLQDCCEAFVWSSRGLVVDVYGPLRTAWIIPYCLASSHACIDYSSTAYVILSTPAFLSDDIQQ